MEEKRESVKSYENIWVLGMDEFDRFLMEVNIEYVLMVNPNDEYTKEYSQLCMDYFARKPNCDILFSSFNKNDMNYQYQERMYFLDDIDSIYREKGSILPDSGYVFRRSLFDLFHCSFFMNTRERYEYWIRNHMNIYCISENCLFVQKGCIQ